MPPFPFLFLPILCIQNILKQIDFKLLVDFSLISRRCHRMVKSVQKKAESVVVSVNNQYTSILFFDFGDEHGIWDFDARDPGEKWHREMPDENPEQLIQSKVEYLLHLFSYKEFYIDGDATISDEYLKNVLEKVNATEDVMIDIATHPALDYNFQTDKVEFGQRATGVTPTALENINPKSFVLKDCQWSADEYVEFITQWFNSENTRFQYFRCKSNTVPSDLNLAHLNCVPFNEAQRSKHGLFEEKAIEMTNGTDILRKDGLLATVGFWDGHFTFYVFHERFPDFSGARWWR